MAQPPAPSAAPVETDNRQAVIDGIKKVVAALGAKGVMDGEVAYRQLIHDPRLLYLFIQACRRNPAFLAGIAVDEAGRDVTDPSQPLNCGVTLAEIEQRLVRTCARFYFEGDEVVAKQAKPKSQPPARNFFGFRKADPVSAAPAADVTKTAGQVKARALLPVMREDWQLNLLDSYAQLPPGLITELGDALLVVRRADLFPELAKLDPTLVRKARQMLPAEDFAAALSTFPASVRGAVYWGPDWYKFFRGTLDAKTFEFFARDDAFFMVCASLTKPALTIVGDMLCYIAEPNLKELTTLDLDKTEAMVAGMKSAFGERLRDVLGHPRFAPEVLHKIVESVRDLTYKPEQLRQAVSFSCKAVAPDVLRWAERKPAVA